MVEMIFPSEEMELDPQQVYKIDSEKARYID
jgi:hypothetical protein